MSGILKKHKLPYKVLTKPLLGKVLPQFLPIVSVFDQHHLVLFKLLKFSLVPFYPVSGQFHPQTTRDGSDVVDPSRWWSTFGTLDRNK